MSTGTLGLGTVIEFLPAVATADPGTKPGSWAGATVLAQVASFDIPEAPPSTVDISNFDTPSNRRESIGGMLDSVTITAELVYSKAEMAQYWATSDALVGLQRWFHVEITEPDATVSEVVFLGTVGSPGLTIVTDDAIRTSVSITLDNDPEFTAGT